jgi:hypothetical protein
MMSLFNFLSGFQPVATSKLRPGQIVYITYCNREVQGSVICHRPTVDQVIIRLLVSHFRQGILTEGIGSVLFTSLSYLAQIRLFSY